MKEKWQLLKELDCPLDSTHLKGKRRLYEIITPEEYKLWHDKLGNSSLRILSDLLYDERRKDKFIDKGIRR